MKKILLFTVMCLFGLFSLNAQVIMGKLSVESEEIEETVTALATPVVEAVASDSSVVLPGNTIERATSCNIVLDRVPIGTVAAPDTTFTVLNLSADS